jgi:hypothetical protein
MIVNELHMRVKQERYQDWRDEAEKARLIRQMARGNKKPGFFQIGWLLLAAILIYNIL